MSHHLTRVLASALVAAATGLWLVAPSAPAAQSREGARALQATDAAPDELRRLTDEVRRMERSGDLTVASDHEDLLLPDYRQERLQQYHLGLKVVGGTIVRQTSKGIVTSMLGQMYRTDAAASATPGLSAAAIRTRLREGGGDLVGDPTLVFFGQDDGGVTLAYEAAIRRSTFDMRTVYLDAATGAELLSLPIAKDQVAVGEGTGVLGDRKKMSTRQIGSAFYADDQLRPPVLLTVDIRSNFTRFLNIDAGSGLVQSDLAVDTDNVWTDRIAVDAHTYLGWTYDFIFKRLNFRGLNNANAPMVGLINVYTPQQCVSTVPSADFGVLCVNAFWSGPPSGPDGRGEMFFGSGIPANFFLTGSGQTVGPLAGALDVVAHELTHGITDYTSALEYRNESGALNESFSDMVGAATEFYFQPRGTNVLQSDYLLGEDAFQALRPGSISGIRSLQSPNLFGHPDHYSLRYIGTNDNGGVHSNSGISNHAFYLAIEGGTNRVSGRAVTGVGFANRDQIERVFFRAFTALLPVRATFAQARAATIQSARDLYPSNTAVERAVTDAWTAVGVQ